MLFLAIKLGLFPRKKFCCWWWEARSFCDCNYWKNTGWTGPGLSGLCTAHRCPAKGASGRDEVPLRFTRLCARHSLSPPTEGHPELVGGRYLLLRPSHLLTNLWSWAATRPWEGPFYKCAGMPCVRWLWLRGCIPGSLAVALTIWP